MKKMESLMSKPWKFELQIRINNKGILSIKIPFKPSIGDSVDCAIDRMKCEIVCINTVESSVTGFLYLENKVNMDSTSVSDSTFQEMIKEGWVYIPD